MKKQKIELSKKLLLNKETIAALTPEQQGQLAGGFIVTVTSMCEDTRQISSCRATRPRPNAPCCMIP
ncbi:class I lanthipeptide [Chitinophaga solisilvae]|uniref:Uncharacterized protein n=1 Tax=Chitinophaga solisilvae TaxID=1233460 RepID=A0A3S1B2F5_9BACT|nr:class I lanthipeptide [Chitinophaga solisilvae]NSL90926.1 hypothetical protein [Chitinophaga solisilvae]